ncbi:hypothetical protein D3C71_2109770 [compost metagenome]
MAVFSTRLECVSLFFLNSNSVSDFGLLGKRRFFCRRRLWCICPLGVLGKRQGMRRRRNDLDRIISNRMR